MKHTALRLCVVLSLTGLGACESTQVTTVWKTPDPRPAQPFTKVLALVINATPGERRAAEDTLAAAIRTATGVPAYTIIPDADVTDRDKVRAVLMKENIDGAAVIRLVSSERRTETYTRQQNYDARGMYDSNRAFPLYRESYTVADTFIHAELSMYSVADDKLLWSGQSTTTNPSGVRDLVRQVSKAAAAELRRQGLLK